MLQNPGGPLHAIGDLLAFSKPPRSDSGLSGTAGDLFRHSLDAALRPDYRPTPLAGSPATAPEYAEGSGSHASSRIDEDSAAESRAADVRAEEARAEEARAADAAGRLTRENRNERHAGNAGATSSVQDQDSKESKEKTESVADDEDSVSEVRRLLAGLLAVAESQSAVETEEGVAAAEKAADAAAADGKTARSDVGSLKAAGSADRASLLATLAELVQRVREGDDAGANAAGRVGNSRAEGAAAARLTADGRAEVADDALRALLRDGSLRAAVEALARAGGDSATGEDEAIDGKTVRILRELLAGRAGGSEENDDESGAKGEEGETGRDPRGAARAAERSSRRQAASIEVRTVRPEADRAQVQPEAGEGRVARAEGELFGPARGVQTEAGRLQGGDQTAATLSRALREQANPEIVRQARLVVRGESSGDIRLVLKPEQLGRVRINLHLEDNRIAGRIIVENSSVKEAFQENLQALQRALQQSGIEAGALEVSVGENDGGSRERGNGGASPRVAAAEFDDMMPRLNDWYDEIGLVNVYV